MRGSLIRGPLKIPMKYASREAGPTPPGDKKTVLFVP